MIEYIKYWYQVMLTVRRTIIDFEKLNKTLSSAHDFKVMKFDTKEEAAEFIKSHREVSDAMIQFSDVASKTPITMQQCVDNYIKSRNYDKMD